MMSQVLAKYHVGGQTQQEPEKKQAEPKKAAAVPSVKSAVKKSVKLEKKPVVAKASPVKPKSNHAVHAKEPAKNASLAVAKPANSSSVKQPPSFKEEQADSDVKAFELQTSILTTKDN